MSNTAEKAIWQTQIEADKEEAHLFNKAEAAKGKEEKSG